MTESIKVQPRWEVDKTGIPQFRPTTPIDPLKPPSIIQEILDRPTFFMKHNQKLTNKSISLNRAHCNNNCDSQLFPKLDSMQQISKLKEQLADYRQKLQDKNQSYELLKSKYKQGEAMFLQLQQKNQFLQKEINMLRQQLRESSMSQDKESKDKNHKQRPIIKLTMPSLYKTNNNNVNNRKPRDNYGEQSRNTTEGELFQSNRTSDYSRRENEQTNVRNKEGDTMLFHDHSFSAHSKQYNNGMSEQYGVTPHKPHELIESRYTMTDIRKNNNHKQTQSIPFTKYSQTNEDRSTVKKQTQQWEQQSSSWFNLQQQKPYNTSHIPQFYTPQSHNNQSHYTSQVPSSAQIQQRCQQELHKIQQQTKVMLQSFTAAINQMKQQLSTYKLKCTHNEMEITKLYNIIELKNKELSEVYDRLSSSRRSKVQQKQQSGRSKSEVMTLLKQKKDRLRIDY